MKGATMSDEEVARYWDENADLWAEHVRRGWDGFREYFNNPAFLKFIGNLRGKEILDAGCGEGYNTRIMAKKGARVTGVDVSKRMIELAVQEERRNPLGIAYRVASASDLSTFEDESFDAIISFMALMDAADYERSLGEFFRVLRKGGGLYFSISHPCFMTKGIGWIEGERGEPAKLTASDYFSAEPYVERWKFAASGVPEDAEPFTIPYFPRTLCDYINRLLEAGFALERVAEPRPALRMCKKHPRLQRWRDHAAIFLYVHGVKY
jgi:ubiquinone/menaquinone biosynthesis C-methylase UbiE